VLGSSGVHEFQSRVTLAADTDVDIATGTTLEFNNRLTLADNTLTKVGGGTLAINNNLSAGGGMVQQFEGKGLSVEEMGAWLASKQASIATAHAQRSFADITLDLSDNEIPDFIGIIDLIENALGTPLQTAVKREDEQAFAKRNAENLMFVEDSVRRLHEALSTYYQATYFRVKVEHQESLHAHDAIAELSGPVHR